ncbi:MAG: endopeptidase La [Deltaproteobacteria bacterium]|nr:endopeptidase La [Deltaproteobacteria bacterium]
MSEKLNQDRDIPFFSEGPYSVIKVPSDLPNNVFILPLSHILIFPGMMFPVLVQKKEYIETVGQAFSQNQYIGLLAKKDKNIKNPLADDLYNIGVVAKIHKIINLPDGGMSMVVQSFRRMKVERFIKTTPHFIARVAYLEDVVHDDEETGALFRNVQRHLKNIISLNKEISEEINIIIANMANPATLSDFVASHFRMSMEERQKLLETLSVKERLKKINILLTKEINILKLGNKIQDEINKKIQKQQKDFFLREELKAIKKELGEVKDEKTIEKERFEKELKNLPQHAHTAVKDEMKRLELIIPESPEYNVIRTHLDWVFKLPWKKSSEDNLNLTHAEKILNRDHYGLEKIKARIIEYLAVKKLNPKKQGSILCFVGPPGVGKTSLGKSIAESLGRKFYRFSLGGMRDEAEINGHRRTYIGAMPGKIIQGIKTVETNNPVFMLDEIDKVGADFRGDPASALLEVLDPEQNNAYLDHYIDIPFDLSNVTFICTANILDTIPQALMDRMEVLELSGYIPEEKVQIAKKHLFPKQLKEHGLKTQQLKIGPKTFNTIITRYTQEAGVRNLNRELATVCRKVATTIAKGKKDYTIEITEKKLEKFLGAPRVFDEVVDRTQLPGVSVGLAWTRYGGEILFIESTQMKGSKSLETTGQLGEVMDESTKIALNYVRSHSKKFGLGDLILKDSDIHIHFPAGATPKDGPSAGIAIATSLISMFKNQPMKPRVAMTGELTLTGKVLPIGGVKEKIVAAKRSGIKIIILPHKNKKDLNEVPNHVKKGLHFHFVDNYEQVYRKVF